MKSFYDFAQSIQVALKATQLYSAKHPKTVDALRSAQEAAERLTVEVERLRIAHSRGKILLNGVPVEATMQTSALLKQLEERKIHGIVLTRGISADELMVFLRILAMKPQKVDAAGGAPQLLSEGGVQNLRFLQVRYEEMLEGEEIVPTGSVQVDDGSGAFAGTGMVSSGAGIGGSEFAGARPTVPQGAPLQSMVKDLLSKLLSNLGEGGQSSRGAGSSGNPGGSGSGTGGTGGGPGPGGWSGVGPSPGAGGGPGGWGVGGGPGTGIEGPSESGGTSGNPGGSWGPGTGTGSGTGSPGGTARGGGPSGWRPVGDVGGGQGGPGAPGGGWGPGVPLGGGQAGPGGLSGNPGGSWGSGTGTGSGTGSPGGTAGGGGPSGWGPVGDVGGGQGGPGAPGGGSGGGWGPGVPLGGGQAGPGGLSGNPGGSWGSGTGTSSGTGTPGGKASGGGSGGWGPVGEVGGGQGGPGEPGGGSGGGWGPGVPLSGAPVGLGSPSGHPGGSWGQGIGTTGGPGGGGQHFGTTTGDGGSSSDFGTISGIGIGGSGVAAGSEGVGAAGSAQFRGTDFGPVGGRHDGVTGGAASGVAAGGLGTAVGGPPMTGGPASIGFPGAVGGHEGMVAVGGYVDQADAQRIAEILSAARQFTDTPDTAEAMRAVLQQAVKELPIQHQALLVASLGDLPEGPMRSALEEVSPELFASVGAGEAASGSTEDLAQMLEKLLRVVPQRDRALELLEVKLQQAGLSPDQLNEIFEFFAFENLTFDEKVEKLLQGQKFEIPTPRLLSLFSHLLEIGKHAEFMRLVELYGKGLFSDSLLVRSRVADGFAEMTAWALDRKLPPEIANLLERVVLTHFIREPDPIVHERATHSLGSLIASWLNAGAIERCYRTLVRTDAGISAAAATMPWKRTAFQQLLDRLMGPESLSRLLPILYQKDSEAMAAQAGPLLAFFGERAAVPLIDALAAEEDRSKRARLIRAIRSIGKPALPPLRRALGSETWYLVRNALTLLGDLSAYDQVDEIAKTLKHSDERVRRAAVRTLGKLGGLPSEKALIDALSKNDIETQIEILHALGALRAETAIAVIQELLKSRRIDEKVKAVATDVLAQILPKPKETT